MHFSVHSCCLLRTHDTCSRFSITVGRDGQQILPTYRRTRFVTVGACCLSEWLSVHIHADLAAAIPNYLPGSAGRGLKGSPQTKSQSSLPSHRTWVQHFLRPCQDKHVSRATALGRTLWVGWEEPYHRISSCSISAVSKINIYAAEFWSLSWPVTFSMRCRGHDVHLMLPWSRADKSHAVSQLLHNLQCCSIPLELLLCRKSRQGKQHVHPQWPRRSKTECLVTVPD